MNNLKTETRVLRMWVTQLYQEYDSIIWRHRIDLKKPVIELVNSKCSWGYWKNKPRTIGLSVTLIKKHSWDVVINVLKHEMAHQIVNEQFKGNEGHGPIFQKACRLIGVPEEFSKATGDIPHRIPDLHESERCSWNNKTLEKVRKLMALAESRNEHEAFLAMKKVNELIKKYNLKRIEENTKADYVYKIINHKKKRIENYQRHICSILMDYYFVEIVFSELFDAKSGNIHKTIELFGTVENVIMAEYVYFFLLNRLEALWKSYKSSNNIPGSMKKSYRLGVLQGFREKLNTLNAKRHDRKNPASDGNKSISALVCAGDSMLTNFISMRFPRLRKYSSRAARIDKCTYEAGIDDGKQLNLRKGIIRKDGNKGRLLT
ncbi:MAG: DUF2786 domain-containing protein [Thermodesulfobacteriota bacterium]|nr:DUF2786 domain-containing protein [Thermodesulfobacteriota bacterium]